MIIRGANSIREEYCLNRHTWEIEMISHNGNYLSDGKEGGNIKSPTSVVYVTGPLIGLAYAIVFLPFICVTSLYVFSSWGVRKLQMMAKKLKGEEVK